MKLADIPSGTAVFVDANTFVYAFAPHAHFGPLCVQLLERIEHKDVEGITAADVLSDVSHRLMSLEACAVFGWPYKGIASRMKGHPGEIKQLTAIDKPSMPFLPWVSAYYPHRQRTSSPQAPSASNMVF